MVCNNCGQECADGIKFCTNCGSELTGAAVNAVNTAVDPAMMTGGVEVAQANPQKEKKPVNKKVVGLAAIALLICCLVAIMNSKADYITLEKKSIIDISVVDENVVVEYANGKMDKLKHEERSGVQYSIDRTVACFQNEDKEIIVIKNGKEIKTNIEEASGAVLSTFGDTIAYLEEAERDDDTGIMIGTLKLYYTKNKKTKTIAKDVRLDSFTLSPNGETVAYTTDWEYDDDDDEWTFKGYYSVNGKDPKKIDTDAATFAIADKAKFIYYTDGDRIYVKKKNKDGVKLADNAELYNFIVNADCTEMIYTVEDDDYDITSYITVKGKEKKKISGNVVSGVLLPENALMCSVSGAGGVYTGVESLKEQLYGVGDKMSFLNKKCEFVTVASDIDEYIIAADMESFVYLDDDGAIFRVTNFAKGGKKKEIADDTDAYYIYAADDLKYVYYLDDHDELYCIKGKKAKMIAEEVDDVAVAADGRACYYVVAEDDDEEELYYVKKAGKGKKVVSAENINLSDICGVTWVGITNDDEYTSNIMKGKKVKEIYKTED